MHDVPSPCPNSTPSSLLRVPPLPRPRTAGSPESSRVSITAAAVVVVWRGISHRCMIRPIALCIRLGPGSGGDSGGDCGPRELGHSGREERGANGAATGGTTSGSDQGRCLFFRRRRHSHRYRRQTWHYLHLTVTWWNLSGMTMSDRYHVVIYSL